MGGQSDKEAPKLSDELAALVALLQRITEQRRNGEMSADDAAEKLIDVKKMLDKVEPELKPKVRDFLRSKWATADQLLFEIAQDELEAKEKAEKDRIALDALNQASISQQLSELVPLYSHEYADFNGKNYVAALLNAGKMAGGYHKPAKNPNLGGINDSVHADACSQLQGVSSTKSIANGLINRVRDESILVVRRAQAAGYDVHNAGVQAAMANLGRAIALTLASDSGGREYNKFDAPRGMAYNESVKAPGFDSDISAYTDGASEDPKVVLASNEQSLINLRYQLSRTVDESMKKRIENDIRRLEQENERIKKKLKEQ